MTQHSGTILEIESVEPGWILLDPRSRTNPGGVVDRWATDLGETLPEGGSLRTWLIDVVEQAADALAENELLAFYLPDPAQPMIAVRVRATEASRELDLDEIASGDPAGLVEPPIVEEFVSARLGVGRRAYRFRTTGDDRTVVASAMYVFTTEEATITALCSSTHFGLLVAGSSTVERLVNGISLMPSRVGK